MDIKGSPLPRHIDLLVKLAFSVLCNLSNNDTRNHSGQNLFWTHLIVQTTLNHISICFYHNIDLNENVFFRARAEKGMRDSLTRAALSGLLLKTAN